MKRIKLTAIIFTAVVIAATISVFSLISRNRQTTQEPSTPIAIQKNLPKSIPPVDSPTNRQSEAAKPSPEPKQISKTKQEAEKLTRQITAKSLPVYKPIALANPTAFSPEESEAEPASDTMTDESENLQADPLRYDRPAADIGRYRSIGNRSLMYEGIRNPVLPNTAAYNRHREMYRSVKPYLQSPVSGYSKEQIEQLNAALAEKLPENYSKMVMDLEKLKEQELARRQLAEQRVREAPQDVNDL